MCPGEPAPPADQEPPDHCPKCGSHHIGLGTVTPHCIYFRCRHCGEIWAFTDRRHVPRISSDVPARRKNDKSPHGAPIQPPMADEPIALNCPRCGLPLDCIETLESPEHPTFYIYKCASHGLFHFSECTDLGPGLPVPGLPPHRPA